MTAAAQLEFKAEIKTGTAVVENPLNLDYNSGCKGISESAEPLPVLTHYGGGG